jgi:hypothetical protein
MSLAGVVLGVTGNFDRQVLSGAVRKAGGRVDALVHKNLDYVRWCREKDRNIIPRALCVPVRAVLASMADADVRGTAAVDIGRRGRQTKHPARS